MTERPDIRRAGPDDVPGMAAVVNDWIDATDWKPRSYARDEIEGFIRAALPEREMFVVGHPVEAYLSFDPKAAKVGALYCRRTGRGIGKELLDHVRAGRDRVWLTSDEPNRRAQAFYRREGFVATGFQRGDTVADPLEMIMEWRR